ncbi:MAG: hypothetical protein WCO63_08765 [Bacteroidota bacterium]
MKYGSLLLICIFFLFSFLTFSCKKKEVYSNVPAIKFVSFNKISNGTTIDNKGLFRISFTDGDGNIGLSDQDTFPPFNLGSQWYYNFFINYYEKRNGILTKIDLPFTLNARIPTIVGSGPNKPTNGEIEIELYINNPNSTFDTIVFEGSICDRDRQLSNVVRSGEIIIKKQ